MGLPIQYSRILYVTSSKFHVKNNKMNGRIHKVKGVESLTVIITFSYIPGITQSKICSTILVIPVFSMCSEYT